MPEAIKREYKNVKSATKGPWWQFSGLILITCFIAFIAFSIGRDKENTAKYLMDPATGDIVEYRIATQQYSTMKIREISQDSIFVSLNDYEIGKRSAIHKIDKEKNYPDEIYAISKEELNVMYSDGDILEIKRD